MFGFGSRSAQTPNELAQNLTRGNGPVNVMHRQIRQDISNGSETLAGKIWGLSPHMNYQVVHISKSNGLTHHSQIEIRDAGGNRLFDFGLFVAGGNAVIVHDDGPGGYQDSTTYKPNPVTVTQYDIYKAYLAAIDACGGKYGLLHNNCQKFARLFMTELGVKHYRKFFHL